MKINRIKINGIGGIRELNLSFSSGFNVICGSNGIGKTTILNTIADAFTDTVSILKRNAIVDEGHYSIEYDDLHGVCALKEFKVKEINPNKKEYERHVTDNSNYVMAFGINRVFSYQVLKSIPKDPNRQNYQTADLLKDGVEGNDLKGWFVNRYLFYDKENSLDYAQKQNFEIARRAFGLLDSNTRFHTVEAGSLDIKVTTPSGEIYYEYLSAGYKTCIYLILGIIKEIEYRFNSPYINADEFNGVILIDEIDIHLHPIWQARLVDTLKTLFPKTQFIVTTHSPSVLQSLSPEEIISLGTDEQGLVYRKDLNLGKYGLQGWTIEEILRDVMDMPETTSSYFEKVKSDFDRAMDDEDIERIKENYAILNEMLHPNNPLRKLLEIQMIGVEDSI